MRLLIMQVAGRRRASTPFGARRLVAARRQRRRRTTGLQLGELLRYLLINGDEVARPNYTEARKNRSNSAGTRNLLCYFGK